MILLQHQEEALELTKAHRKCAYYYDMGLGKTYIGSEKLKQLNTQYNLIICQKSKLDDWLQHFKTHYPEYNSFIYDKKLIDKLTKKGINNITKKVEDEYKNEQDVLLVKKIIKSKVKEYVNATTSNYIKYLKNKSIIIINYDSVWLRPELLSLEVFTMLLDESQYIKNPNAQRTKFINQKLIPTNIILLSGTPISGKYEELITQCNLLGWKISQTKFYERYVITKQIDIGQPYTIPIVVGYKNIDELKTQLRNYGAVFMRTEECLNLPDQIETTLNVDNTKEYKAFKKDSIVKVENTNLVGENPLTKLLYLRQLAGLYNANKIIALEELLESTDDRVVIFYNFREEFNRLSILCKQLNRPISYVNGDGRNLKHYENDTNSITLVQYQSGASGLNLQLANKMVYYSLPLSADMYMQSMARIRRIGQNKPCFYYYLISKNTIEEHILQTLKNRQDFTLELFRKDV